MDPLLPTIDKPTIPKPVVGPNQSEPFDSFIIPFAVTLAIGTQLLSKSAPHLAGKVFENVLGPEMALGAKQFKYPLPKAALMIAPAPFGWVPPQEFGLPPNYLAGFNKFVTFDVPSLGFLKLPESHLLKTLPDNDPVTKAENFEVSSRKQRKQILDLTQSLTLEQVLDLYTRTQTPDAGKVFFDQSDVARDLQGTIFARVGQERGQELLAEAKERAQGLKVNDPIPPLPPNVQPSDPQRLLDVPTVVVDYPTTADLFADLRKVKPPVPKDAKPVNALQQIAAKLAPRLLRDLESERADP